MIETAIAWLLAPFAAFLFLRYAWEHVSGWHRYASYAEIERGNRAYEQRLARTRVPASDIDIYPN